MDSPVSPDEGGDSAGTRLRRAIDSRATSAVGLVVAVAVVGLVLRLLFLGDRIAHWDEARVGYWILYYAETGSFAYRRIIHGPFVQHVNRWLFPLLGANDFTMRLPVALVSATLPLSAALFREHLRKVETVALALFLAVNPVILYYSRFMRSDLLVATFMFLALGTLVRFYDTRRWRYLYAAAALSACGFASKENAVLYVLTWLGALGLLADQALYRPREYDTGYQLLAAKAGDRIGAVRRAVSPTAANGGSPDDAPSLGERLAARVAPTLARYGGHIVGIALVFLALSLFFYAPRGAGEAGLRHPPATTEQVLFWQAVGDPTLLPGLVEQTWTHVSGEYAEWFGQAGEGGNRSIVSVYAEYLGRYVRVMGLKATALTTLGVLGFLHERYVRARSRNLVLLSAYCGFVSVLGYPLGTDIFGAWIVVHAVVPLAVPAAVGLAQFYDWGRAALAADDGVGIAVTAAVLLLIGGQVGLVVVGSVYQHPQSGANHLVQYAQPSDDPRAEFGAMKRLGDGDASTTEVLLYYGETGKSYDDRDALVEADPAQWNNSLYSYEPLCSKWFNILPLPWYFASADAEADCARDPGTLAQRVRQNPPPMVITTTNDRTVPWSVLHEEYTRSTYSMRTSGTRLVYWVRDDIAIDRETDTDPREPTPVRSVRRGPNAFVP